MSICDYSVYSKQVTDASFKMSEHLLPGVTFHALFTGSMTPISPTSEIVDE